MGKEVRAYVRGSRLRYRHRHDYAFTPLEIGGQTPLETNYK